MIKLKEIESKDEIKQGKVILTVNPFGGECIKKVECVDNDVIHSQGLIDGYEYKNDLNTILDDYKKVYEVTNE